MKTVIFFFLIAFLTLATILVFGFKNSDPYVVINGRKFSIDAAKTDLQKEKGLAVYNNLPIDRGMVFSYEKSDYYTFWMKNMKFPIDIIYINNSKIVDIFENVAPPKTNNETLKIYKPRSPSNLILEINAGLSRKYDFKIGDIVKIDY